MWGAAGAAGAALRRATRPEGPLASCRYRAPCPAYVSASHAAYVDLALERPLGAVGGACGRRLARFAPRSGRWRTPVDPKPRPGAARHVLYVFPPHIQHVLQGRSARTQDVSGLELGILGCHGHANGVQGYAPDRGASIAGLGDFIRHRHHDQMGD